MLTFTSASSIRHQLIRIERQTRLQCNYLSVEESEIKLNLSFVAFLVCMYEDNYLQALIFSQHVQRLIIFDSHIVAGTHASASFKEITNQKKRILKNG